jgi:Flp pilus assembly protein TadG
MAGRGSRDDRGVVLPLAAMVLVILMIMAAFTVDVGAWYARASKLQRAADAAALAGVVWMPNLGKATAAAVETAAKNGFVDGVDDISIVVSDLPGNNRRLRVTITDNSAEQYFSTVVVNKEVISRRSTAEYVLPVPLGSPTNTLGTGNLLANAENMWLAVSGYCAAKENGDLRLSRFDGSYPPGGLICGGTETSTDYDPDGYTYSIDLAQAPGQAMTVELYDPSYAPDGGIPAIDLALRNPSTITTIYTLTEDTNRTPFVTGDDTLIDTFTATSGDATWSRKWMPMATISNPIKGTYYLNVKTLAAEPNSFGSNGFSIRGRLGGAFASCTTIAGVGYSASCPQVHGVTEMSIFANLIQGGGLGTANFYLAQVDAIHAGKQMVISLFDSGEGASKLEILDPNGNPAFFKWKTPCSPPTDPSGGCFGSGTALDVSGGGIQPGPQRGSGSKYNDRMMELTVDLPQDYVAQYGTKVWWKIRYTVAGSPTDRTTWSVKIVGDPVHLVSER